MTVSRLKDIPGIGVNEVGDRADAARDPEMLRMENLDTDVPPPSVAVEVTRSAVGTDAANSYLPFEGHRSLRAAAAAHVSRIAGVPYDPVTQCVSVAGGLNGVLNALLATVEPGREVVIADPIYAGLVNRIRLAGGVPRHVPARPTAVAPPAAGPNAAPGRAAPAAPPPVPPAAAARSAASVWRTDPGEFAAAIGPDTAAVLLMGPAMPTGALLEPELFDAIAEPVARHGVWVIYDAAMERIRFDGRAPVHPAGHPGLADRTITVGSASKELRMIGWRVGWVTGPRAIMSDIALVGMTNVVCQVGIAQDAVAAALSAPDAEEDVAAATAVWRDRCAAILDQLAGYPVVRPEGGWSLLIDVAELGLSAEDAARHLFERGRVAATPMTGWGPRGDRYVRLVFANEPVERLTGLRARFETALAS